MAMAMTVSCAHLNVLGPSLIATDAKSCNRCSNAASPSLSFRSLRRGSSGGRSRSVHRSLVCRASGSRKDKDRRRGAKPGEEEIEGEEEEEVRIPLPDDEAAALSPEVARSSYVGDKFEPDNSIANDPSVRRVRKAGERVGEGVEDVREEGEESARAVAGEARDAADASGKRVQKAGRRVGQNVDEVLDAGEAALGGSQEVVERQAERAADNVKEGLEEVGDAAKDVLGIGDNTAEEVGKEGRKVAARAGNAVTKQARAVSKELGPEAEEAEQEVERTVRTTFRRAQESAERVQEPIEKAVSASVDAAAAIRDEVAKLVDSIVEAVEDATGVTVPGRRGFRRGGRRGGRRKSFSTRRGQDDGEDDEDLVAGKYRPAGKSVVKRYQGVRDEGAEVSQEADGSFSDFTVLVAGASGATGRLIVQDLVGKGAKVRALVRNVYRARNLPQLEGAELFEADLYNYESVKEAISGSDVVISAVGTRGIDPLATYRTEYEGVLNLISAAKNQGDIKKFVLITTIGVNFLQIIPLLYWKRQAELFLQRSGLDYTIVRPAGLTGDRGGDKVELRPADSLFIGGVSRRKVAEVCVSALVTPSASEKTVELVGGSGRVKRSIADQFDSI